MLVNMYNVGDLKVVIKILQDSVVTQIVLAFLTNRVRWANYIVGYFKIRSC